MLSDEEKKEYEELKSLLYQGTLTQYGSRKLIHMIEKQSKEIEELKASHITTNNKATNTEKAKIFDVIENSIDTYIEKSKPYWEQTEKETIVDLSKMDYIKFTNLEWASVIVLREVQSLNHKLEKWKDKIKAKIEEYLEYDKKYKRYLKDGRECFTMEYYYAKMLQSLLENKE